MSLILLKISILMCGLCFRLHASSLDCNKQHYQRGSDVTLQCDVPLLSETSTLQWIKDGGQTSNTTLVYNNSAYIILHNVDEHSEGKYYCRIMQNGSEETVMNHTVCVTQYSETKKLVIYRQSSSHSDLLLICKSKREYQSWSWVWETKSKKDVIISVEKRGEIQVNGTIKPGNKTSGTYNSQIFNLHLSPVKFNYSGTYKCIKDNNNSPYTITTLHTIRVSAEPPGGVLMNESVVLTCEVSDVTDSVMLAWLRMHGDRGVLFKQRILNEKNLKKRLTVNVNSISSDMQHWQCAVFTENKLKALAPITISLLSNYPVPSKHAKSIVITAVTLFAGILLGVLVYYWYRKQMSGVSADGRTTTIYHEPEESEPVYVNLRSTRNDGVRSDRRQGTRNNRPEIHSHLPRNNYGQSNIVRRDETPVTPESITYAAIYFKEPRLKTSPYVNKPKFPAH